MLYSSDIIDEVSSLNDIVAVVSSYINLKRSGRLYFGSCPFHNDPTPSFSINPDKQLYYCFGCGASGNVITFIMNIENYDFVTALKFLADRVNYQLPEKELSNDMKKQIEFKKILYDIHVETARFFYMSLNTDFGKNATKYLDERTIKHSARKKFGLGYSPNGNESSLFKYLEKKGFYDKDILKSNLVMEDRNDRNKHYSRFYKRLMFPIFDVRGRVIAFGGRIIGEGNPKYLNSSESKIFDKSRNLYGLNFALKYCAEEIILVEGYMDVISLYQAGIKNVVASLGTAFNTNHARVIKNHTKTVLLLFDSDEAGTKATLRTIPILLSEGLKVKVLGLENAKDPDEFIKKFGIEKLSYQLKNAKSYIEFQVNILKNKYDLNNTEQKLEFTYEVSKVLSGLKDDVSIDLYTTLVAKITNIDLSILKSHIEKVKKDNDSEVNFNDGNFTGKRNYISKINSRKNKVKKGLSDAKKILIQMLSGDYKIYLKLSEILKPEEFQEEVLVFLVKDIYNYHKNKKEIIPSELVSHFETVESQQIVSEIFNDYKYSFTNTDIDKEKALNDCLRTVKKAYITTLKSDKVRENDTDAVAELWSKEKNIDELYITLLDG